jgi:hypothetical protein
MAAVILIGLAAVFNFIGAILSSKDLDKLAYAFFGAGLFFIFLSIGMKL